MSTNMNYTTGLYGFFSDKGQSQGYQAASASPFNQLTDGKFAAYALFWIDAAIQAAGAQVGSRQFIWGNFDEGNSTGWGIYLEDDGNGQLSLFGTVAAASGVRSAELVLSGTGLAPFVERLMCVGLWYNGSNISLTVNGSMAAFDTHAADAYAGSAVKASLGCDPAGDNPASDVRIVSVGYAPNGRNGIGAVASSHFKACREAYAGGYLDPASGIDWAHRYEAANAGIGQSGSVTKSNKGPVVSGLALAPASIADLGNQGPSPYSGVSAVALSRLGVRDLQLDQVGNMDWYQGGSYAFTGGG